MKVWGCCGFSWMEVVKQSSTKKHHHHQAWEDYPQGKLIWLAGKPTIIENASPIFSYEQYLKIWWFYSQPYWFLGVVVLFWRLWVSNSGPTQMPQVGWKPNLESVGKKGTTHSCKHITLPKTNIYAPQNGPKRPKTKRSSSNHPFSGTRWYELLVSGRVNDCKLPSAVVKASTKPQTVSFLLHNFSEAAEPSDRSFRKGERWCNGTNRSSLRQNPMAPPLFNLHFGHWSDKL